MNVPIILGYDNAYPKPSEQVPVQYEATWLELNFTMLGSIIIAGIAVAFSLIPVFV